MNAPPASPPRRCPGTPEPPSPPALSAGRQRTLRRSPAAIRGPAPAPPRPNPSAARTTPPNLRPPARRPRLHTRMFLAPSGALLTVPVRGSAHIQAVTTAYTRPPRAAVDARTPRVHVALEREQTCDHKPQHGPTSTRTTPSVPRTRTASTLVRCAQIRLIQAHLARRAPSALTARRLVIIDAPAAPPVVGAWSVTHPHRPARPVAAPHHRAGQVRPAARIADRGCRGQPETNPSPPTPTPPRGGNPTRSTHVIGPHALPATPPTHRRAVPGLHRPGLPGRLPATGRRPAPAGAGRRTRRPAPPARVRTRRPARRHALRAVAPPQPHRDQAARAPRPRRGPARGDLVRRRPDRPTRPGRHRRTAACLRTPRHRRMAHHRHRHRSGPAVVALPRRAPRRPRPLPRRAGDGRVRGPAPHRRHGHRRGRQPWWPVRRGHVRAGPGSPAHQRPKRVRRLPGRAADLRRRPGHPRRATDHPVVHPGPGRADPRRTAALPRPGRQPRRRSRPDHPARRRALHAVAIDRSAGSVGTADPAHVVVRAAVRCFR